MPWLKVTFIHSTQVHIHIFNINKDVMERKHQNHPVKTFQGVYCKISNTILCVDSYGLIQMIKSFYDLTQWRVQGIV